MKFKEMSDWGNIYYEPNLPFIKEGNLVEITWPDGKQEKLTIESLPVEFIVGDMGKNYKVNTRQLGFHVDHHGIDFWVGLHEVNVEEVKS